MNALVLRMRSQFVCATIIPSIHPSVRPSVRPSVPSPLVKLSLVYYAEELN